jgi:spermidine/putrescine transport system permease protein
LIKHLKKAYLGLILFFLYAPIAAMIIFSFNQSRSQAAWTGFSLRWYADLLNDRLLLEALRNTILIAVLSTAIAVVIGTAAAIGIHNMGKIRKNVMLNVMRVPIFAPEIVTGISLMLLFLTVFRIIGFGNLGFMTILFAHITFNIPYVILSILPRLRQLDNNLFEAAMDLGASPLYTFRKVLFPEIRPGVITGALLAFTMSIDDFIISYFTAGSNVSNLSIYVFSATKRGVSPRINALSAIMFTTIIILLYIVNKRAAINSNKELREE